MGKRVLSFLFTTFEAGGVVGPVLAAGGKLLARGHRVRVMSDEANRVETERAGLSFAPWRRAPSRADRSRHTDIVLDWAVREPAEGFIMMVEKIMCGPAAAYALDLRDELRRERADLVVANDFLAGTVAACEALGQPVAVLTSQLSLYPLPGVPPLGPGLMPAQTDAERQAHAVMAAALNELYDRGLPALNAARSGLGLAPLAHVREQFDRVSHTFLGTARAFDFAPAELPAKMSYVGPVLGARNWASPWVSPRGADDGRPLVVVAFSTTFQNHAGVLQRVMDAAAGLPVRVVVTLGGAITADELRAPDNALLVDSADHDQLMAEAAVVVTHGGHGTLLRALCHRRPTLVIPHGRDQNDNAVRAVARGAALSLAQTAGVAEIGDALRRLLSDRTFAAAAGALGDRIAAEVAASPLIGDLEALAAGASVCAR